MHEAFRVHMLNEQGKKKAARLVSAFEALLTELASIQGNAPTSRYNSLVITHLELASFYAKKAMAQLPENHDAT